MTQPNISLDNIRVASPCPANWDEMTGDEKSRFCGQCQLNVYNLSALTKTEAEELITSKEGRMCVRYYIRPDGTILTSDCPIGVEIRHKKVLKIRRAGIAAAIALVTFAGMFTTQSFAEKQGNVQVSPPYVPIAGGIMVQPPTDPVEELKGQIEKVPPVEPPIEVKGEMVAPPPECKKPLQILGKPMQGSPAPNPNPPKEEINNNPPPREMGEIRGRVMVEMGDIAYPQPPQSPPK